MAGQTDRYSVVVTAYAKDIDKTTKKLDRMVGTANKVKGLKGFGSFQEDLIKTNKRLETSNRELQRAKLQTTALGRAWEQSKMGVLGFNGALLSTLFFGMELQRIFGGALKSIFEGYKKIIPESSAFNVMTTKLAANWEFFKFQLADALAQSPIFQKFIEFSINLLSALQKLPEPVKTFITILLVVGTVLGGILFLIGVWGLGVAGLIDLYAALAGAGALGAVINKIKLIFTYKWTDLATDIKSIKTAAGNVATKLGEWVTSLKASSFKKTLGTMAGYINAFAATVLGGTIIMAAAFLAAYKISEWGLKQQDKQYKNIWAGIAGTVLDAVVGIISLTLSIPAAIIASMQTAFQKWKEGWSAMIDVVVKLFQGDFEGALSTSLNFTGDYFKAMGDNFISLIGPVSDLSNQLKDKLNLTEPIEESTDKLKNFQTEFQKAIDQTTSNKDIIGKISSDRTNPLLGPTFNGLEDSQLPSVTPTNNNNNQNIQNIYNIGMNGEELYGDTSRIREAVDITLRDSGLQNINKKLQGYTQ